VPLVMEIRETSDAGTPVVVSNPEGPQAQAYREIAARVWDQLAAAKGGRAAPAIVFE
jgi:ATP-binding protein involved in chromosome partitioning